MNTALLFDSNGNFRPDKKKSNDTGRIDGIVASVMALSRVAAHEDKGNIDDAIFKPIRS
jgi:phage terminase large subunit-like protein